MKIDGKKIAGSLFSQHIKRVRQLKKKGVIPTLNIILIGSDQSSQVYVREKLKAGKKLGVNVVLHHLPTDTSKNKLSQLVYSLNLNKNVHGVIIQRPVPVKIDKYTLNLMVVENKDVDGFHPQSLFDPPVALAVVRLLQWVEKDICSNPLSPVKEKYCQPFWQWFKKQKILLIGRGETAGKPIAKYLTKNSARVQIAHSQTINLKKLCLSSDIIISCIGKSGKNGSYIVRHDMVTKNTILIGVGLHPEKEKLQADYDQGEMAKKAAYFTPVPGGVGPVNVACLFKNLILSTEKSTS